MNFDPLPLKSKKCKAYSVVIELEVQAITCPGVWLCNNGKVTMQIYLLGLCTQTSTKNPVFPLLYHEKFIFRKNFTNIQNLCDIDRKLDREVIYMELIQWENCETGNVLATFKTSLNELLYPFPSCKGVVAGVDVDLLMEATRIFPGIIAPKIEVSTKFSIEEVLCTIKQEKQSEVIVVNPKLISSKCVPKRKVPVHQKKVCHTKKYHKSKTSYPPFRKLLSVERIEQPINTCTSRQINRIRRCSCVNEEKNETNDSIYEREMSAQSKCKCKSNKMACDLCCKYKMYFSKEEDNPTPSTTMPCKICRCTQKSKSKLQKRAKPCQCNEDNQNIGTKELKNCKLCLCTDAKGKQKTQYKVCRCNDFTSSPKSVSGPSCIQKKLDEMREDLQRSLSSPSCLSYVTLKNNCDKSCNERFYRDLENFYKELYLRAHYKLKNEHCKCAQRN